MVKHLSVDLNDDTAEAETVAQLRAVGCLNVRGYDIPCASGRSVGCEVPEGALEGLRGLIESWGLEMSIEGDEIYIE